ncbi:MAG: hypothetical protein AAF429_09355 [Pseudomonadota bacterium]
MSAKDGHPKTMRPTRRIEGDRLSKYSVRGLAFAAIFSLLGAQSFRMANQNYDIWDNSKIAAFVLAGVISFFLMFRFLRGTLKTSSNNRSQSAPARPKKLGFFGALCSLALGFSISFLGGYLAQIKYVEVQRNIAGLSPNESILMLLFAAAWLGLGLIFIYSLIFRSGRMFKFVLYTVVAILATFILIRSGNLMPYEIIIGEAIDP